MVHDIRHVAKSIVGSTEAVVTSAWQQQSDRFRMAIGGVDVAETIDRHAERIDLALSVQLDA